MSFQLSFSSTISVMLMVAFALTATTGAHATGTTHAPVIRAIATSDR